MRSSLPDRRADAEIDRRSDHPARQPRGDREVHSVCPYCGVGCQISYQIKDEKIAFVQGRDGYSNENRLCVKGRFGFDYVTNPQRLMTPLIRKPGLAKGVNVDPADPYTHFREASWDEALDFAALGLAGSPRPMAARPSPASARPNAPTKRPICSRS